MSRLASVGRWWRVLLALAVLAGYWLVPISGQVLVVPGDRGAALTWPRVQVSPGALEPGRALTIEVSDIVPWGQPRLTVNGQPAGRDRWWTAPGGVWTWQWTVTLTRAMLDAPDGRPVVAFYRDCDTGCIRRGQVALGGTASAPARPGGPARAPTKLGLVFADPQRDWHGRQGWDVEVSYSRLADSTDAADERWMLDNLAAHVATATAKGLRVLVRVDLDRGQSLPPTGDELALSAYLRHLQRLARDERLRDVHGYVIGASPNAADSNQQAAGVPLTPAWYARLVSGYGEAVHRGDNAVQTIRQENPRARVLVGPIRPWVGDGAAAHGRADAPWLGYMDAVVRAIDASARAKAGAGLPFAAPDGFALQAPGRPGVARARFGGDGADEPRRSLVASEAGGAQLGFGVYADFLDVVNAYPATRGLPAYITATNTYAPDDGVPPAQGYPPGWLSTALQVINEEPQVVALCWFMDGPMGDRQWDWFSLSRPTGRLIDAAEEFDRLLRQPVAAVPARGGDGATAAQPERGAP